MLRQQQDDIPDTIVSTELSSSMTLVSPLCPDVLSSSDSEQLLEQQDSVVSSIVSQRWKALLVIAVALIAGVVTTVSTTSSRRQQPNKIDYSTRLIVEQFIPNDTVHVPTVLTSPKIRKRRTTTRKNRHRRTNEVNTLLRYDESSKKTKLMKVSSTPAGTGSATSNNVRTTAESLLSSSSSSSNSISNSNNDNVLLNYLHTMHGGLGSMIILKWAPNGLLQRYTPVESREWFPKLAEIGPFSETQPSEYGTVAMVLNSDILSWINWDIVPPVPLLVYTLPDQVVDIGKQTKMFQVVPHPYDLWGYNKYCVWYIEQKVGLDLAYEEYMDRSNVIVWRGNHHDEQDVVRLDFVNLAKRNEEAHTQNNEIPKWLDAADVGIEPSKNLEMRDMITNYRYQIDIGGVSGTSWGGTRWKLCTAGLVFRVDTFSKDWWHNEIIPWEHYIPVAANLSNLYEMYIWAEQHPDLAYAIGQKGRSKCHETLEKQKSEQYLHDVLLNLPPASKQIIDNVDDIFKNHMSMLYPASKDEEYNGGYTNNTTW